MDEIIGTVWGADWLRGIRSDPLPDADNAAVGSIGILDRNLRIDYCQNASEKVFKR